MFIICSYIRFPLYIFAHLQIYIIRTKLRSVRSSFFQGMLKSSFCGRLFGRSPSGRAFRCKSSLCCGLSPAIPNVGERAFTVLHLNLGHGLSRPGVRFRPFRDTSWPKPDIGAEGQTEHIRPCRHTGLRLFAETSRVPVPPERVPRCLSGSRKLTILPYTSPVRISLPWETGVPGSPEGFFFLHPESNLPLTEMTDRAFFP